MPADKTDLSLPSMVHLTAAVKNFRRIPAGPGCVDALGHAIVDFCSSHVGSRYETKNKVAPSTSHRVTGGVVPMKHPARRHRDPDFIEQDLIPVVAKPTLHAPAVRRRAARACAIGPLQALEPRRQCRIGIEGRCAHGRGGTGEKSEEDKHPGSLLSRAPPQAWTQEAKPQVDSSLDQ